MFAAIAALPELDGIADTIGGAPTARLLGKVRRGGVVASVAGEPPGLREHGLVGRALWAHGSPVRLAELAKAIADGQLVIPIAMRLPLAKAAEAQTRAEGHAGGKVILTG